MIESFGARLRQRREEQQITLITIAEQTKIKLSLLEALERDDVSHWPSGIFRRAFIRAYAHAIGLDPDVVVREFLEVHPEPVELVDPAALTLKGDEGRTPAGPPTRLRYIVGSAIGTLARLRRGPAVEDVADGDAAADNLPAGDQGIAVSADPQPEPTGVVNTNEAAVDPAPASPPAEAVPDPVVASQPVPEPVAIDPADDAVTSVHPDDPSPADPDLGQVAELCTEFGRVGTSDDVLALLQEAARILDAAGLIVWVWDPLPAELRPALVYGYSDRVLAQLPAVRRDADNATAAAFRSGRMCAIDGGLHANGALVVPLLTPAGCGGVLAIELQHGGEQRKPVRAIATIFAAQLSQLIGSPEPAEVRHRIRS